MSSQRIKRLHEMLTGNPFHKKVLLTSNFSQGHQWLEQLSRTHGSVLNVSVQSPRSLALQHAQLTLVEKGLTYTSPEEIYWIVQWLMRELASDTNSYIPVSLLTPGVVHCFCSAISELRHAKIGSAELDHREFENPEKGIYVQKLLSQYESYMIKNKLVDDAELRQYVQPDPLPHVFYIVDEHLRLSKSEQDMLNTITRNRLHVLESDVPFTASESGFPFTETSFFHSLGPVAEVREVLRRMAEQNASWDEVEIIASDYAAYASAIHTAIAPFSIPCTYSQGLPISYSKAGLAASLYFEWLESGYNLDPILQACKLGLLYLPSEEESVTGCSFIRVLEKSGIGWGRERYSLLRKVKESTEHDRQIIAADLLADFFDRLFEVLPEEKEIWSPRNVLDGMNRFCDVVPSYHEYDMQAKSSIKQLLHTLDRAPYTPMERRTAIDFAREMVEGITIATDSMPSEGKLHVSSLRDGGQSGRRYTFIVGMDENSWTVADIQDPILLDMERIRISPHLITSKDKAAQQERERTSRLNMIRGTCTLSFHSYRVADNQEVNPAFELLQVFRHSSGNPEATYENLLNQLELPIGMVTSPSAITLDGQEAWMKRLIASDGQFYDSRSPVISVYPHLGNGERAVASREDFLLTEYDGVFTATSGSLAMETTSASKLELYARCPLQYFYQEVLGIKPKEVAEFDRSQWLDAAQRGSLLHAIFQQYLLEANENGGAHDYTRLQRITETAIQQAQQEIPAPSVHVMLKESDEIRKDVEIFWEGELQRTSKPRFMELALHGEDGVFQVELGDELVLPLKGYVDRVDELEPSTYKVIDYKTGNPRKFKENEYFSKGTQLQHAIYSIAVEQWLQRTGIDPQAKVVEASYYFPTFKGQGHEVTRSQNRREATARLVSLMITAMEQGLFPPTQDPGKCKWCDFRDVCGNHAVHMKEKRNDPTNGERLSLMLEVEDYE
ncbi:PD-(D/E)XK nuclease family protein [Brevibacillus sp. H7]|uniref:PD-(D/E)XK nuclease family protein n=1 Tax=Brevibacillus sp. H7 TaxID=3349138 RepID=UPI00381D0277